MARSAKLTATNPTTYGSFLASETTRDFPSATQDGIPASVSHDATRKCSSLFLGKSASSVRKEIQPNVSSSSAIESGLTASKTKLYSNFKSALAFGCLEVASSSPSSRGGANQNPFSIHLSLNAPEVCLDSAAGDREVYLQAHALVCRFTKFWEIECLKVIGNGLGKYHSISKETINFENLTFARLCVEMDVTKGLPAEIFLKVGNRRWRQPIDYEKIAFKCRRCFTTEHATAQCGRGRSKDSRPSWWDGVESCHYVISPSKQNDVVPSPIFQEKIPTSPHLSQEVILEKNLKEELKLASPTPSEKTVSQLGNIEISSISSVAGVNNENLKVENSKDPLETEREWTEVKRKKTPSAKQKHPMTLRSSKKAENM